MKLILKAVCALCFKLRESKKSAKLLQIVSSYLQFLRVVEINQQSNSMSGIYITICPQYLPRIICWAFLELKALDTVWSAYYIASNKFDCMYSERITLDFHYSCWILWNIDWVYMRISSHFRSGYNEEDEEWRIGIVLSWLHFVAKVRKIVSTWSTFILDRLVDNVT